MRIKTIQLSWFRGAADPVSLETNSKSMVVYGENGSGKSSFVDSVEYILNNGRISHLAHEYSGKHQEKAVHNTHKPQGQKTDFIIKFADNSELKTEIKQNGTTTSAGAESIAMNTWNYRRTVLRQDEVAAFVHGTKGDKYSALLPLLGLDELVTAAENLRQLVKSIEGNSKIRETKTLLNAAETKRKETFNTASDDQILKNIEELYVQYCPDKLKTIDALSQCKELDQAIQVKGSRVTSDYDRYRLLQNISQLKIKEQISAVRFAISKMAGTVEPLIVEKLEVLQSTGNFVDKLDEQKEVTCPSCGQSIVVDAFQSHIKSEKNRLQEIIEINNTRRTTVDALCDSLKSFKSGICRDEAKMWQNEHAKGPLSKNFVYISELNIETLRASCDEEKLVLLEDLLLPLIADATSASKNAPPDTQELLADKNIVDGGRVVVEAMEQAAYVLRVDAIMSFINLLEQSIRAEIRTHTETVIKEISIDIQRMWGILHPANTIKKVNLYIPPDEDKAIDISLEFYGIAQPSPRITLSEGFRNSLGLSIFLSMAKRASDEDRPLFLDDVIVSLDRNHRGMIADLLKKEFSERQVIIFTHDRDWYTELRHQLDDKNWIFKTLLPYETPEIGIRWSHKTTTFGDARAHNKEHPDSAGNDARKIMDVELAIIAEKLRINFPYLRAEKNDMRMAHDFLERFICNGKKCFEKKVGAKYEVYLDAIEAFNQADRLIVSWGNRASHTFDVVSPEAEKLIDACEKALEFFKCPSCSKNIWLNDAESCEWVQCQCGEIRWRYGKAG
jgi:energy-coupling factor transporter ATP-binding protein EcfA2